MYKSVKPSDYSGYQMASFIDVRISEYGLISGNKMADPSGYQIVN
jgi:hypothetical protein